MPSTIACSFGDVFLVPFPFSDQAGSKSRPGGVVSSDAYHRHRSDAIIVAVTSQLRGSPGVGELAIARWAEAGLAQPSQLKPVMSTVDRRLLVRKLGRLHDEDVARLRELLTVILG